MKTTKSILGLLIAGIMCITSCNKDNYKGFYFNEKAFTSEWNKWKDTKIENYSFVMEWELPNSHSGTRLIPLYKYKAKIIVSNGVMHSFEYIGNVPHDYEGLVIEPEFTSISDMYQKIFDMAQIYKEWWYENPNPNGVISTKFEIEYDKNSYFIKFFKPVSRWEPDWIVDTLEHTVMISEFTIISAD